MRLHLLATVALVAIFAPPPIAGNGGWNDPTSNQFHIQTDEGPERYFRYQTQSGQYRKEKRLEDGTVVGSYGWIDSDGLLRLRDYIADNAGYRILRTKDVYVGRNRPISQAIKAAKKVPSSGGTLLEGNAYGAKVPAEYVPPSSTPHVPQIDVAHNIYPASTNVGILYPSTTPLPPLASTLAPSLGSTVLPSSTPIPPIAQSSYASSTPSPTPIYVQSTTPETVYITSKAFSTPPYVQSTPIQHPPTQTYVPSPEYVPSSAYQSSTLAPPIDSNSLDYYSGDPQYEHYNQKVRNPYLFHNGPTYPIDRNGNPYLGYNVIGNGYDPQYSTYNGQSVTNDGFRYYIPRAYHEEQNEGGKQSGSFGYVDPFGIRRVIYYNAGANGFQHRKNNRYVGLNATPYDPRPY